MQSLPGTERDLTERANQADGFLLATLLITSLSCQNGSPPPAWQPTGLAAPWPEPPLHTPAAICTASGDTTMCSLVAALPRLFTTVTDSGVIVLVHR